MVCTCKCTHHIDLQGPSFSVEYDNYPATESAGEVEVCVAYYGTQPLASDATVQLRTLDNPVLPGQSPGKYNNILVHRSGGNYVIQIYPWHLFFYIMCMQHSVSRI